MQSLMQIFRNRSIAKQPNYSKFIQKQWDTVKGFMHKSEDIDSQYRAHWVDVPSGKKVFVTSDTNEIVYGFIWLKPYLDGYSVYTLGIKPEYRGQGIATMLYDTIISKKKLYSDKDQSPEARSLWTKLYSNHEVLGYSEKDNKTFKVKKTMGQLVSADSNYILYDDDVDTTTTRLVAIR